MSENKQNGHYRNVFKSDHLGVVDLEEMIEAKTPLIFTIKEVKQEFGARVAGKMGDFNIAYFVEDIKPWVLNAGNSKILRSLAGGSVTVFNWKNISVELYIDPNAKMKGEIVGGVRLRPKSPKKVKSELIPTNEKVWENALIALNKYGNLDKVKSVWTLSEPNELRLKAEAKERKDGESKE